MPAYEKCSGCGKVLLWVRDKLLCVNPNCTGHEPGAER